MKKSVKILLLTIFLVPLLSFGQTYELEGNLKGAQFSAKISYKPDCYFSEPFLRASLYDIDIHSYTYNGNVYSGNDLEGISFPINVEDGYLELRGKIRFDIETMITLEKAHLSLNFGGDGIAHMADKFNIPKGELKSQGLVKCEEWIPRAKEVVSLQIIDGHFSPKNSLGYSFERLAKKAEKEKIQGKVNNGSSQNNNTSPRDNSNISEQEKIAEIKEMERKAQEGSEEKNEKQTAREFHEEHTKKNNDRVKKQQAQKKAEQNHESQRKKQSELSNNQQQEVASRSHNEALAELGVAAILVHLAVGYTIYNTIGDVVGSENTYRGNGTHHQLNVGYGLSYYNMSINNVSESPFMINLGATYHLNLVQGDNFGIGIRTDLEAGHSILLDRRLEYGFGGNIYLGHKNIRLFTELQYFNNNITFAKSNVTNSNIDKYSLKWRGHRLSLGPLFSWNGNMNHIKILYNWNYLRLPTKWNEKSDNLLFPTSNGVRVEYLKRNHFQFYAQYNNLVNNPSISPSSSFYTSSNGASTGGLYSIGIRRTWDWHKKGALDNSLEKIRKQNFSDKNTYLSILNPIIEWGSLQRGQDEFLLDGPQLSFNLISAEKQFSISKNFVGLLGLGISSLRRVSGVVSYAERTSLDQFTITNPYNGELLPVSFTPIDPEWGVAYKTKQINRFSPFDFELPIGVQYFFSGTYSDRYWAAAKLSPVFSFGELGEDMRHYEGDIFKSFHMIYRLGVGVDLPRLMNQNLRFGIYYFTRSNTIDLDNVTQHINGVQFQMALGF